jgi:hypothetical protein
MNRGRQLLVALLVLGGLIGATLLVWRDPFEKTPGKDFSGVLPARSEGTIDRIAVTNKEGSITAEKRGDTWWITEPKELPADSGQLKAAAATLEKIAVVDAVSKKPERQEEYGLAKGSPERMEVKAFAAGTAVVDLAAGKRSPDGQGTFILLAKDPNTVYVTSETVPFLFGRTVKEWRSKTILDLRRESIDRIQMTNSKGVLDLVKETGDQWQKKDDPSWHADNARLGQVLDTFTRLPWVDVVDEPDPSTDYGFNAPQAKAAATAESKGYVLVFGKDVEGPTGNCWLKLDGDPKAYQVRKAILDRFTRDFDYYRGEAVQPDAQGPKKEN